MLHTAHLRLAEDLEQLIVGQEVEATKARALSLQIVAEALLHHVQQLAALSEFVEELRIVAEPHAPSRDGSHGNNTLDTLELVHLANSSTQAIPSRNAEERSGPPGGLPI